MINVILLWIPYTLYIYDIQSYGCTTIRINYIRLTALGHAILIFQSSILLSRNDAVFDTSYTTVHHS